MEKVIRIINGLEHTPVYTITPYLRWKEREIQVDENLSKKELCLQQMWRGSDGSEKWEFVPEYDEIIINEK